MNTLWTPRWTTQRDVCQRLLELLDARTWPLDSSANRRQLAAVLAVISDAGCAPRWQELLLNPHEDLWVRLRARDALDELGARLSEAERAALLLEWLAEFDRDRSPFPLQVQDLVTLLVSAAEPSRYLAGLRALSTRHQGDLLKDARLPDALRGPLQESWLAALRDDLSGIDVVWDMLDQAPVRRWALASPAPLSPIQVRRALADASLAEVEAFFDGFPGRLEEARAAFCLPLPALALTAEEALEAIHACFRENRAYRRVSPRSINACATLDQLGEDARREARGWEDIHPDLKKHWLSARRSRDRGQSEDELVRRAGAARRADRPLFLGKLSSARALDRYYALEWFAAVGERPPGLVELAERDPHPVVRIQAAGLHAMDEPSGLAHLRERARAGAHVCERAEALRWLEELDLEGSAEIFVAALDDRAPFEQHYLPALGQAIQALQAIPGEASMTALLRAALRGPCFYSSELVNAALRYRLGRAPEQSWRFVWRRLALRRPTL